LNNKLQKYKHMKIDNKDVYYKIRGQLIVVVFITATLITLSLFYSIFTDYFIPINKVAYACIFGGLLILFIIYRTFLKYHYIIYDDESDKIILRYYPVTSLTPKHLSIEIPYNTLYKIEIKKKFFNQRDELIIYQIVNKGVAKYKPIPLTALSKKEKKDLINALNFFAKIKMQ